MFRYRRKVTSPRRNNRRITAEPFMPTVGIFLPRVYSDGIGNRGSDRPNRAGIKAVEAVPRPAAANSGVGQREPARPGMRPAGFPATSGDG